MWNTIPAGRHCGSRPSGSGRLRGIGACRPGVPGYDQASGVTLGQTACSLEAGKGGEIAAARDLAAALDERGLLAESVVTVDAGFAARELAADLRVRGARWILRIKGNQKTLHARLKALPWADVPEAARVRSVGHGRVETRTIRVIDLTGSSDGHGEFFPAACQALKIVRRRRGWRGPWSVHTVYAITSLDPGEADPALLACWVRDTGASRPACTGSTTSSSPKTTARSAPPTARPTSPLCAPWGSTSSG